MRFSPMLFILGCLLLAGGVQFCVAAGQAQATPSPARAALGQMSRAERKNSSISVEFETSDSEVVLLGREVEHLWNAGQYDEALARLDSLEATVGHVAIGNSWRKPVPTLETTLWGRDVRIGNRDSLVQLAFDGQAASGNLFVALRPGSGYPHFSVCVSTDSGATWEETFTWNGSPPTSIAGHVVTDHFYVAYNSPGEDPQHIRLRRFRCSDGSADTFHNGDVWVIPCTLAVADTMKEVSLTSSGWLNMGWLYMAAIASDGSVWYGYCNVGNGTWSRYPTGITSGASQGIDLDFIWYSDSSHLFLSYYDTSDTLRICTWIGGGFTQRFSLLTGTGNSTSLSGCHDTVVCVYEDGISSPHQIRYAISYDNGYTWTTGTLSSVDTAAEAPAVAPCTLGVLAAVYRHEGTTRELRFRRRIGSGPWSDPVSIADNEPYWSRPGIECLDASGVCGVAYLSNTIPVVRGAYYNRSDWVYGIAEQRRLAVDENILSVFPNPLSGLGQLTYTLNRASDLRMRVYDRAGRAVLTLFDGRSPGGRQSLGLNAAGVAPGVYFIRAEADGRALTVPVTVVK